MNGAGCATFIAGFAFYAHLTGLGTLRRNALQGLGFADSDVLLQGH